MGTWAVLGPECGEAGRGDVGELRCSLSKLSNCTVKHLSRCESGVACGPPTTGPKKSMSSEIIGNAHSVGRAKDGPKQWCICDTYGSIGGKKFRLLSWNVNGLGDKMKRGIVLQIIKRHAPEVVLLQETHLVGNTCRALDRWSYRLVVHSGFTTGSRGVGIMIRKSFAMSIEHTWVDNLGRYVAVTGKWEGGSLTLVSVYVPLGLQTVAFGDLGRAMMEFPEGGLLLGGKFNSVGCGRLDRCPPRDLTSAQMALPTFLDAISLTDVYGVCTVPRRPSTHFILGHTTASL